MRRRFDTTVRASLMIEAAIALGIVSVAALSIIGLLGQSNASSRESKDREEAVQNLGFVKRQLEAIPFKEVYEIIQTQTSPYYSYQYSANPEVIRLDGSAQAGRESGSRLRKGFRRGDDPLRLEDLKFSEGAVFRVRLSPLPNDGNVTPPLPPLDKLLSSSFSLALEFFIDPRPGENEEEWEAVNRVLRVPVSIAR